MTVEDLPDPSIPLLLKQSQDATSSALRATRLATAEAEKIRGLTREVAPEVGEEAPRVEARALLAEAETALSEVELAMRQAPSADSEVVLEREKFRLRQVIQLVADARAYLQDAEDIYEGRKEVAVAPPPPPPLLPPNLPPPPPAREGAPARRVQTISVARVLSAIAVILIAGFVGFQILSGPSAAFAECLGRGGTEQHCLCEEEARATGLPDEEIDLFCDST